MFVRRRVNAVLAVSLAAVALIGAACSSTQSGSGGAPGTSIDVSSLIGPPKQATGTPIKIGLIDDGKSTGIDHTPLVAAFNATVQYANEHLGGINGHVIEVDECATNNTPSDATSCGVKMVNDAVAAVLVPVSAQDATVYDAMKDSGIPYFTYAAGSQDVITGSNSFLLVNPIATQAGPAKIAKDAGISQAGIIIIDVPSATGSLKLLAEPIYQKAGVGLSILAISPQTADMTPQIQQAIGSGAGLFSVVGTDEFNTAAIKSLKQLGFTGKLVMVTPPTKAIADNVPGGLEGVVYITSTTTAPDNHDVQLYDAVLQTYMKDVEPSAQSAWAFVTVKAFVDALQGSTDAVDAASVSSALKSMPKPLPLPLGAGLTYQCGATVVAFLPSVCTGNVLSTTLDAQGQGQTYEILDVSGYLTPAS